MVLLLFVQGEDLNRNLFEGLLQYPEEGIPMGVIAILIIIGDLMMDVGPMEEEDNITIKVEGHQIEGMTMIEVILEEENPLMMEYPLMMEDPLMMVNHLMMEGPLMMEDHLMMEDPWKWKKSEMTWMTRTTRPTRTSWTHMTYHSTATPGYIGYNSFGKYLWDSWPVNVTIG